MENHNKILKDQLFHFVGVLQTDWDLFLPTVQLMYNTTVSSATSLTPFFLMYGRECNVPTGEFFSQLRKDLPKGSTANEIEEYADKLVMSLECAWTYAVGKAEKNFLRFNSPPKYHRNFVEFEEGQEFMRLRKPVYESKSTDDEASYQTSAKLQARYDGPHRVIRKISQFGIPRECTVTTARSL